MIRESKVSRYKILNLSSTEVLVRTSDLDLSFYNMNIDAIAMPCPICEEASKKLDELSEEHVELYLEHLQKSHGMTA
jgi:hypothetical protein